MRTQKDWTELTDPLRSDRIAAGVMTEQFPGAAREAIRAFRDDDAPVATVPGQDPATLNSSIRSLGLEGEMYAEQRGTTTVLRKINE